MLAEQAGDIAQLLSPSEVALVDQSTLNIRRLASPVESEIENGDQREDKDEWF